MAGLGRLTSELVVATPGAFGQPPQMIRRNGRIAVEEGADVAVAA
jgi:hypothetical protein